MKINPLNWFRKKTVIQYNWDESSEEREVIKRLNLRSLKYTPPKKPFFKLNLIRKEEQEQLGKLKQIEWGLLMYKLERFCNPTAELEFSKNPHEERARLIEQINRKYGQFN